MKLPMSGACRCGQVQIRVSAPPFMTAACHCTGCQRMSASAFSLTAMIPGDAFEVMAGSPVIGGLHGAESQHYFCPHCMTWMFTRFPGMDHVNLRPTMLEDCSWFVPFIETMTRDRLPWATTPAKHSFEGFPAMEQFGPLMAEYAEAAPSAD